MNIEHIFNYIRYACYYYKPDKANMKKIKQLFESIPYFVPSEHQNRLFKIIIQNPIESYYDTSENMNEYGYIIYTQFHKETNLPVVLLGKSYKKNVNLTVGSPADLLAHMLAQAEIDFTFYDPIVWPGQLEPGYPAVYFISCNHDLFKNLRLPKGSICIDPWGDAWIKTEEVRHIRIGREVLFN